jgi:hypothetical protein
MDSRKCQTSTATPAEPWGTRLREMRRLDKGEVMLAKDPSHDIATRTKRRVALGELPVLQFSRTPTILFARLTNSSSAFAIAAATSERILETRMLACNIDSHARLQHEECRPRGFARATVGSAESL